MQAEFRQQNLQPGEYLTIVIGYPPGTTSGKPMLDERHTLATAFTVNAVTGAALIGLLVLLLGGVGLLYSTRGRDARIVSKKAPEGDHAPVDHGEFSPPDGVRPGQIGTLIDEQADVIDVTATIIDLAVRRYLLIEELTRETYGRLDWQLRRLDRPADELMPYERVLYDALFAGRDVVRLSELGGTFAGELSAVRGALYEDVVRQGWFTRRPDSERTRWTTTGTILAGLGVIGTIALALYTNLALIGLALIIAGAALAMGGQYMPAKTAAGATVLAHTLGFRAHLYRGEPPDAPSGRPGRAVLALPAVRRGVRLGFALGGDRGGRRRETANRPTTSTGTRGRRSGTCRTSPSRCGASRWRRRGRSRPHGSSVRALPVTWAPGDVKVGNVQSLLGPYSRIVPSRMVRRDTGNCRGPREHRSFKGLVPIPGDKETMCEKS